MAQGLGLVWASLAMLYIRQTDKISRQEEKPSKIGKLNDYETHSFQKKTWSRGNIIWRKAYKKGKSLEKEPNPAITVKWWSFQ